MNWIYSVSTMYRCFLLALLIPALGPDIATSQNLNYEPDHVWNYFRENTFEDPRTEAPKTEKPPTMIASSSCPGCQGSRYTVSEDQLTALRIEFVKNQILKKLRLKERPAVSVPLAGLPRPVADGVTIQQDPENANKNADRDDFYGRTTQKIIFPKKDALRCAGIPHDRSPSACFPFDVPEDVDAADVSIAELWIYKHPDSLDSHNQTFIISEVGHWDINRSFRKTKPIAIQETDVRQGWVKIDLAWAVKNWFQYKELTHAIHITCKTCGMEPWLSPVSIKFEHRPFIVIDTHSQTKKRRQKRHVNCSPGVNECCREKLYISFADIGWDDWILQPTGYHAYFCRGSCSSAASVTLSGSHYNSVIRKMLLQKNLGGGKRLELVPCCTATQFSSLQLLYMDSNNTATQKTLPNMVVESCGCM